MNAAVRLIRGFILLCTVSLSCRHAGFLQGLGALSTAQLLTPLVLPSLARL